MAATISATLRDHQKGRARKPHLRVRFLGQRGQHEVLRWTRYYTGAEADAPHDSCIAGDGSLVRARNDAGTLRVSRVTAPGSGSTYSTWTSLGAITAGTGVALTSRVGEILLVYVDSASDVALRTSTDNGATWSGATVLVATTATWVAVTFRADADACAFYAVGAVLNRVRRTAGTWGAGVAWTNTVNSITGVGARYLAGDFHLHVSGTEASTLHKRVWGVVMGDGNLFPANTWGGLGNTAGEADVSSTVTFQGPHLAVLGATLRCAFSQRESAAPAFDRAMVTRPQTTNGVNARHLEPEPHEAVTAHGLALCASLTEAWGTTPSGVWRALRFVLAAADDESAKVVKASWRARPDGARCSVELSGALGTAWAFVGAQIELTPGYLSGAAGAPEYGATVSFVISRVERTYRAQRLVTVVEGVGLWEVLEGFRQPQSWQVASGAVLRSALHIRLLGRAGFGAVTDGTTSAPWSAYGPAFAVAAGESYATALRRLMSSVGDQVLHDSADRSTIVGASAGGASSWTFGPADHPITQIEVAEGPAVANWERVQGKDRYQDQHDFAAVYAAGARQRVLRDFEVTTDARAADWAAAMRRRDELLASKGQLLCALHAGVQLWDVVTLNDATLGLSGALHRVVGLGGEYERRPGREPRYDSVLELGPR